MGLEDHLLTIRREVESFKPRRLVMDSVSAMERVATVRNFREFIIDSDGLHIGKPFKNVQNILLGIPSSSAPSELKRIEEMFQK
jgi:hypothetical protein